MLRRPAIQFCLSLTFAWLLSVGGSHGAEWVTLKGRFVYDGEPPKTEFLTPNRDVDMCGKKPIPDDSLVVNSENGGIANIILYPRKKPSAIAPSYDETAKDEVPFDNVVCRFEPHVQLLRTTQQLVVGNKDPKGHNTNFAAALNAVPNQLIPALGNFQPKFTIAEPRPVKVDCNIHPWMSAYLVVKDHPYIAKTDEDGNFEIKDLPVGEKLDFRVWHESSGWVRKVKSEEIKFGKKGFKVTMTKDIDLGTVKVDPKSFD